MDMACGKGWLAGALLAGLLGCAGDVELTNGPDGYDSERARDVLIQALEAWKGGRVDSLERASPPIRFVDEDQRAGARLLEFRLAEPDQPVRAFAGVPVQLQIVDERGVSRDRKVSYQVALEPRAAVLRAE